MMRTRWIRCSATLLLVLMGACGVLPETRPISEHSPASRPSLRSEGSTRRLKEGHRRILELASPEACARALATIAAKPHPAGSIANYRLAKWVEGEFMKAGLETRIEEFEVPIPYPDEITVEMLRPVAYRCPLSEARLDSDFDTHAPDTLGPYLAYAADGDVAGPVIYVNYGTPADWDRLAAMGLDVSGCIAMVRYGKLYRGAKVLEAKKRGVAALLIYSDPADDGFVKGPVYPDGPWRPRGAVQRGSVLDISQRPGDPLTPGTPAIAGMSRLSLESAPTLPGLPAAALSWGDAEPILKVIEGSAVPDGWQGGLPFAYRIGGTEEVVVRVRTLSDWRVRKIYNVIGTLRGSRAPEEWVVMGNHRDAWVHGAADPGSGTVAMVEAARMLGELAQSNLRPSRSIVFCSFDAEEFGLIGSTEHVENSVESLASRAVLYLNCDTAVTGGTFSAWGAPPIASLLREALGATPDDRGDGASLLSSLPDGVSVSWPGGGSDHAAFVHVLGIPALEVGSSGPYGVYHSLYDTYGWMKRYGDPGFLHHARMSRAIASVLLESAEVPLIPYDALAVLEWIESQSKNLIATASELPRADYSLALEAARSSAHDLDSARREVLVRDRDVGSLTTSNAMLLRLRDVWLEGKADKDFYRNTLVKTDSKDGYSAITMPKLRAAAIEDQASLDRELKALSDRLSLFRDRIDAIVAGLRAL